MNARHSPAPAYEVHYLTSDPPGPWQLTNLGTFPTRKLATQAGREWRTGYQRAHPDARILVRTMPAGWFPVKDNARVINQYLVLHEHRHGLSHYVVECPRCPTQEEVIIYCNINFEPDREETIAIHSLLESGEPIRIP